MSVALWWCHRGLPLVAEVVLDPVGIPPFHRVDRHSGDNYPVVQMVAAGQAGGAGAADDGAFVDLVADAGADGAEVGVEGLQAEAVVDDYAIAVDAEVVGEDHLAAVGGRYRRVGQRGEVDAEMGLLVDLVAAMDVGALLVEAGPIGGVGQPLEGPLPGGAGGGLAAEFLELGPVLYPQLAVDAQEDVEHVVGFRVEVLEFRHLAVEELLADVDAVALGRPGVGVVVEAGFALVAGPVGGDHPRQKGRLGHVEGEGEQAGIKSFVLQVAGEEPFADLYPAALDLLGDLVQHQAGAALVEVVRPAQHRDHRRPGIVVEAEAFADAVGQQGLVGGGDLQGERSVVELDILQAQVQELAGGAPGKIGTQQLDGLFALGDGDQDVFQACSIILQSQNRWALSRYGPAGGGQNHAGCLAVPKQKIAAGGNYDDEQ